MLLQLIFAELVEYGILLQITRQLSHFQFER